MRTPRHRAPHQLTRAPPPALFPTLVGDREDPATPLAAVRLAPGATPSLPAVAGMTRVFVRLGLIMETFEAAITWDRFQTSSPPLSPLARRPPFEALIAPMRTRHHAGCSTQRPHAPRRDG